MTPAPDPAPTPDLPPAAATAPADVDLGRRRFFRQFAGELVQTAATMAGAAQALQRASAEAAAGILDPATGAGMLAGFVEEEPAAASGRGPTGFRTPFREGAGVLYLIDQRRLPDALLEIEYRSAGEVAYSMRTMIVRGAPALGQVAAIGLALSAERVRESRPYARRATLRGGANALVQSRPTAVNVRWAVDRMMARYEQIGDLSDDGDVIADAMRAEADRIVLEATTDHGRMAGFGLAELPQPEDRPVRILTHCNTGPLACGQFGTALGVVQAAHHAGRPVHVWVDETRPVPAGRPAHRLGARPGRRAAHADRRHGRRIPDGPRRGRRGDRRGGPHRGERRHGQQDRHVHPGRAGGPPRHPVLRLRPDDVDRPRGARRGAIPIEERSGRGGQHDSAASPSRRWGPRSATRPSTSRRPSSSPGSSPRRASSAARSRTGSAHATAAAIARWTALPGHDRPARIPPEPVVAAG